MSKLELFKVTFFTVGTGLFVGILVYNLFEINFYDSKALLNLFIKSITTSVSVGLILGIINAVFEIILINKK